MLDPRAQHLLKTLVERYVAEGQPVGSRLLSRHSGLDLSPATIRNVMADLEEMGLIASPHTSAGRVPTPRGYRFFVDSLMVVKPLEDDEIHRLEGELSVDRPQQLVNAAASLLSQLTQFAGVVATPKRREAVFLSDLMIGRQLKTLPSHLLVVIEIGPAATPPTLLDIVGK